MNETYVISEDLAGVVALIGMALVAMTYVAGYLAGRHVERKERETK